MLAEKKLHWLENNNFLASLLEMIKKGSMDYLVIYKIMFYSLCSLL